MWYIEMGGNHNPYKKGIFQRNIFTSLKDKKDIRKKFNNTDVYATIYQYNNKDIDKSDLYGPMYLDLDLDIDSDAAYEILKNELKKIVTFLNLRYEIPIEYMRFYFSGKKGFHIFIPASVFGIQPDKKLNIYYKALAKEISKNTVYDVIDLRIYDNKRLVRLANSINSKSRLYKVPITYDNILLFSYSDIKEYAKEPKHLKYEKPQYVEKAAENFKNIITQLEEEKKKKKYTIPKNVDISKVKFPECIKNIFENGASKGSRNNTAVILASALFQKGIDYDTGFQLLNKWNHEKVDPSINDNELTATIRSAYNLVQAGKRYGCNAINDLGLCVGKECRLYK